MQITVDGLTKYYSGYSMKELYNRFTNNKILCDVFNVKL